MAGKHNDLDALKDEAVVQDDVPAVDESEQIADLSADEAVASEPEQSGDSVKRTVAGNTDPADFSVFDDNGNFIEKRDR